MGTLACRTLREVVALDVPQFSLDALYLLVEDDASIVDDHTRLIQSALAVDDWAGLKQVYGDRCPQDCGDE